VLLVGVIAVICIYYFVFRDHPEGEGGGEGGNTGKPGVTPTFGSAASVAAALEKAYLVYDDRTYVPGETGASTCRRKCFVEGRGKCGGWWVQDQKCYLFETAMVRATPLLRHPQRTYSCDCETVYDADGKCSRMAISGGTPCALHCCEAAKGKSYLLPGESLEFNQTLESSDGGQYTIGFAETEGFEQKLNLESWGQAIKTLANISHAPDGVYAELTPAGKFVIKRNDTDAVVSQCPKNESELNDAGVRVTASGYLELWGANTAGRTPQVVWSVGR
jgi:hypothetical protein